MFGNRFHLQDIVIVAGGMLILAVMVLLGPGKATDEGGSPATTPSPPSEQSFWMSWPGALVVAIGGGALAYVLLALWWAAKR